MTDAPRCPECGEALASNAPHGLCPKCLARMAVGDADLPTASAPVSEKAGDRIARYKLLEKNRARRYETANALAQDIENHLRHQPVAARPPSTVYRVQKFVRRNKLMVTAAALVATALVLGITVSTWQAVRATLAEREQSRLRKEAESQRQRAERSELATRHKAYTSDMNLVAQALQAMNLGRARELLYRQIPEPGQQDLRGWEWRYLWQQCQGYALAAVCQKTNSIFPLSVSHDGKWLAIGENDDGKLSHGTPGFAVAKDFAVAAVARGDLQLIGLSTGKERWSAKTDNDLFTSVAFSPDGKVLVSAEGSVRSSIRFWESATGRELGAPLTDHRTWVPDLLFFPDGKTLASASTDQTIRLWDVSDMTQVRPRGRALRDQSSRSISKDE